MNDIYGIDRFLIDLSDLGYSAEKLAGTDNQNYAVIRNFDIPVGRFQGQIIDLGFPVPNDYPRLIGTSIHIRSVPQLLEYTDTIPNVRNIITSALGSEWRYWSFRLEVTPGNTTLSIIYQIHGIFQRI
jgi:hypothetical protein